jgi:hypothetical protein
LSPSHPPVKCVLGELRVPLRYIIDRDSESQKPRCSLVDCVPWERILLQARKNECFMFRCWPFERAVTVNPISH